MEKVYQQRERENESETFSPICQGVGFVSHLCLPDTKQSSWHLKRKCLPILPEVLEFWSRENPELQGVSYLLNLERVLQAGVAWEVRLEAHVCPLQPHCGPP